MDFDASRKALLHPESATSRLLAQIAPSEQALACEAARLAYYRWEESDGERTRLAESLTCAGFASPELFEHPGSDGQGFGACREGDKLAILAFRGTQPDRVGDLLTDADARLKTWRLEPGDENTADIGSVHAGFANTASGLWEAVKHWRNGAAAGHRLVICGHSLGAAIATLLAMPARADALVTIGSPRIGDGRFCAAVTAAVPKVSRFVGCCDVVTTVPPSLGGRFGHVGDETYIDRAGVVRPGLDPDDIRSDRSQARLEYAEKYAFRFGTVLVRDLADHAPANYLRALWP